MAPSVELIQELRERVGSRIPAFSPQQRLVRRGISVPGLRKRKRVPGSVWAVGLMRNEQDIAQVTLRHLLRQGVAGIIVADNMSTDDTLGDLRAVAREDPRVFVGEDREPGFYQGDKTSWLAELARRAGADWVLPFDADEHFYAEGMTLGEFFRACGASAVWADSREVLPTPESAELRLGSGALVQVETHPIGIPKVAFRSSGWVWVGEGNHTIRGWTGPRSTLLHLLHYQYRSLAQQADKVRRGTTGLDAAAGLGTEVGAHWRSQASLSSDELAARWQQLLAGTVEDHGGLRERPSRVVVVDPSRWSTWDPNHELDGA